MTSLPTRRKGLLQAEQAAPWSSTMRSRGVASERWAYCTVFGERPRRRRYRAPHFRETDLPLQSRFPRPRGKHPTRTVGMRQAACV